MVWLTRFDGTQFVLNADLIECAEATPDTVLTLTNGHHYVVREEVDEVAQLVVDFRRRIHTGLGISGVQQ
ncbi:MAG: flagellar FlbD family protein [Chloroflexota bacterium]|nr:flagellar FlbD family protein [Chloroflexota bacterium]